MNDTPTKVLLVEDNSTDAGMIQTSLASTGDGPFRVAWVRKLSDALERLGNEVFDVVLLDLTLPGCQGVEAFDRVFSAAPNALILVLSTASGEETARQAVQRGAYDSFSKDPGDIHWLPRTLRYAIERKAAKDALCGPARRAFGR